MQLGDFTRHVYVMKVPPPSLLTWCFSNSLMVLTSTPQIDLLKFLKKNKKYNKNRMIVAVFYASLSCLTVESS